MAQRTLHNIGLNTDWDLGQDGWKEGMDKNLLLLDTLAQPRVISIGQNSPPGSPDAGDVYIVGSSPSGAWSDHPNAIAVFDASEWTLIDPLEGWRAYNLDDGRLYKFIGGTWWPAHRLNNVAATTAPGASDDETEGYGPMSVWINTSGDGDIYMCIDATTGAARWREISVIEG